MTEPPTELNLVEDIKLHFDGTRRQFRAQVAARVLAGMYSGGSYQHLDAQDKAVCAVKAADALIEELRK